MFDDHRCCLSFTSGPFELDEGLREVGHKRFERGEILFEKDDFFGGFRVLCRASVG